MKESVELPISIHASSRQTLHKNNLILSQRPQQLSCHYLTTTISPSISKSTPMQESHAIPMQFHPIPKKCCPTFNSISKSIRYRSHAHPNNASQTRQILPTYNLAWCEISMPSQINKTPDMQIKLVRLTGADVPSGIGSPFIPEGNRLSTAGWLVGEDIKYCGRRGLISICLFNIAERPLVLHVENYLCGR